MNNDLISREALKKALSDKNLITWTHEYGDAIPFEWIMSVIDNSPAVDIKDQIAGAYNEGYMCGNKEAEKSRPQGEWYECLDKGLLKARHGNYVVYDVDYLLDNLAREVNLMESVRRQKGGAE